MKTQFRKSATDKAIAGVCGGIAEALGISSFAVRLIFLFLPVNIVIYIILAYALPDSPPSL